MLNYLTFDKGIDVLRTLKIGLSFAKSYHSNEKRFSQPTIPISVSFIFFIKQSIKNMQNQGS